MAQPISQLLRTEAGEEQNPTIHKANHTYFIDNTKLVCAKEKIGTYFCAMACLSRSAAAFAFVLRPACAMLAA
jgi:hypothetical protein